MLGQPKYDYRRRLPHIQKSDHALFITFATAHRWILPPEARSIAFDCCLAQSGKRYELYAAVVMPDHVHMILNALRRPDGWCWSLPEMMHSVKGASAWSINKLLERSGPVWQEEFFDHVLRGNESLAEKVEYVCNNPIRAELIAAGGKYPWVWRSPLLVQV